MPARDMIRRTLWLLVLGVTAEAHAFTAQELWQVWPEERFIATPAPCLLHAELTARLGDLADRYPDRVKLEEVGRSVRGQAIHLLTLGRGEQKILLWSQMHGDEPSATPALLDIASYLSQHAGEPGPRAILERVTLLMLPMLNPDGAEVYERRNAQAIDINRDALNLATPEGRILKQIRDQHRPLLGLNLHDQNRRTAAGDTKRLATSAVLAVAGDREGTVTPGRLRAKRACSAIVEALTPFIGGSMARYDEDWSPRAFGDNLTAWGTPVVLIESGGLPPDRDFSELTRLNFVAILMVLQALVTDDLAAYDPTVYEQLPRNRSNAWTDVAIRGGYLLQPGTSEPYRADLAFNLYREDRLVAGCGGRATARSQIFEIGDDRFKGAGLDVDAAAALVLAPFEIGIDGWSAHRWLDGDVLDRMARLGVATVLWRVKRRRGAAAFSLARTLNQRGRPRVDIVTAPSPHAKRTLAGPPAEPDSDSLAAVVRALAGEGEPAEAMQDLWPRAVEDGTALPTLRPGQPASLLLVKPAPAGRIDFDKARLISVWLDGSEIALSP